MLETMPIMLPVLHTVLNYKISPWRQGMPCGEKALLSPPRPLYYITDLN